MLRMPLSVKSRLRKRWRAHYVFRRNLSKLRVVQGIEGFPAKLQPPLLSDRGGLGPGQAKVVDPARHECVPAYRERGSESSPLDPLEASRGGAQTGIRAPISC